MIKKIISTADTILNLGSPSTLKKQQSYISFLLRKAKKTAVLALHTLIDRELEKFLWGMFLDFFFFF